MTEQWPWKPNPKVVYAGRGTTIRPPPKSIPVTKGVTPRRIQPKKITLPSMRIDKSGLNELLSKKLYTIPKRSTNDINNILKNLDVNDRSIRELVLWWAGFEPSTDIHNILKCTRDGLKNVDNSIIASVINENIRGMYPELFNVVNYLIRNNKSERLMIDISKLYVKNYHHSSTLNYQSEIAHSANIAKEKMQFIDEHTKMYIDIQTFTNVPTLISDIIAPKNITYPDTIKEIYGGNFPRYNASQVSKHKYIICGPSFQPDYSGDKIYPYIYKIFMRGYEMNMTNFKVLFKLMMHAVFDMRDDVAVLIIDVDNVEEFVDDIDKVVQEFYASNPSLFKDVKIIFRASSSENEQDRTLYITREDVWPTRLREKYKHNIFVWQVEDDFIGSGREHTKRSDANTQHPIRSFHYSDILNSPLFSTSLLEPGNWKVV